MNILQDQTVFVIYTLSFERGGANTT